MSSPSAPSRLMIVDKTLFYNKMQDLSISKFIFDFRKRMDFDESHVRASFPLCQSNDDFQHTVQALEKIIEEELDAVTITQRLATLTEKYPNFKMRGYGYKTVILYGDDIIGSTLNSQMEKNTKYEQFRNCEKLLPSSQYLANGVDQLDQKNHPVLLLAEVLRREKRLDTIIVLDSYSSFCDKYPFLLTVKDKIGFQGNYPSEIIENFLYLGNKESASSDIQLTDLGVTYILNMAEEVENDLAETSKYVYLKLGTGDTVEDKISNLFDQSNKFLQEAREKGTKVIVNCNMGISRSTTAVLSYIMKNYGLSFDEAFHHAKGQRAFVCPNQAFRVQLQEYYKL